MMRRARLVRLRMVRQIRLQQAGQRLGAAVQSVQALRGTALRIDQLRDELGLPLNGTDGYTAKATESARALLDGANRRQHQRVVAAEARRQTALIDVAHGQAAVDVIDQRLQQRSAGSGVTDTGPDGSGRSGAP